MASALSNSAAMMARRQVLRAPSTANSAMVAYRSLAMAQQQRGYATPSGPPPKDFRTSTRTEWQFDRESTLDRLGRYFLMTEMARGMYVLLEQFFRPPYVRPDPISNWFCRRDHISAETTWRLGTFY